MAKDDKRTLTPRLRFPEFRKEPNWCVEPLGELFDTTSGGTPDRSVSEYWNGSIPWITTSLVDFNVIQSAQEFITEAGLANSSAKLFPKNTVLVALYGQGKTRGKVALLRIEATTNQACAAILPGDRIDPIFTFLSLCGRYDEMRGLSNSGGQENLSQSLIRNLSFPFPKDIVEQQKIVECLTSLDELIAAQGRKVEALKAHKKGLMQQLFPAPTPDGLRRAASMGAEGRKPSGDTPTIPRLRFPEFRDAPDWSERPLAELAAYENGKAYEQDIQAGGGYVVVNSRFISTDGAVRKHSNADYCVATEGDVLMVLSDLPNGRALAKCFFVDVYDQYAVNQRVARLTPIDIRPQFLFYRLNRHPNLLAFDDGLSQTHLSKGSVLDCPLCVPTDQAEQQRIADCLSTLDARIAAETEKLTALKTHKQGLMQQLFPSPEEV